MLLTMHQHRVLVSSFVSFSQGRNQLSSPLISEGEIYSLVKFERRSTKCSLIENECFQHYISAEVLRARSRKAAFVGTTRASVTHLGLLYTDPDWYCHSL
ncbi:hypothetical protein Tcan_09588 [Toxocara canis]|uniref:Uncharacterized protein n=1 Tax=Toxocara canis TaxID=6265 RepID=A0A0B2VG95_TOXCA|nr:hypothetical protein Tcan_09588 [Toxocara canis]